MRSVRFLFEYSMHSIYTVIVWDYGYLCKLWCQLKSLLVVNKVIIVNFFSGFYSSYFLYQVKIHSFTSNVNGD